MEDIVNMAASEEQLPEPEQIRFPDKVLKRWRTVGYICVGIVLPVVLWAGALDLAFISMVMHA